MSDSYPCSLVLAAHGSQAESNSNQPVFDLAAQIASQQIFSEVTPAFLHGDPHIDRVLDCLPIGDVIVIPVMTSQGYFSRTVVPERLAQNGSHDLHRVLITPVLGTHPRISELVSDRITSAMESFALTDGDAIVVLVGHGTSRNPDSSKTTYELATRIREHLPDINLQVGFLDQEPMLDEVVSRITAPNRLVIPFLISRGPHATVDVPAAFGLPTGGQIEFPLSMAGPHGITVCDLPVGMYPEIAEVCLEIAADKMLMLPQDVSSLLGRRSMDP